MADDLISSICRRLDIPNPGGSRGACRAVYSVAGQMALASLWDHGEEGASVSVRSFKDRIEQVFNAYEDIYPEIRALTPEDKTDLIDDMYAIYLRNGFFYHSSWQISPAAPAAGGYGGVTLYRGSLPGSRLSMSGLGFYSVHEPAAGGSIAEMFGLQEQPFESFLEELLERGEWESTTWPENTEFLRLDPPFTRGYWQRTPCRDGRISLARFGEPRKILVFCRFDNGVFRRKAIPEWRMRDWFSSDTGDYREYRRIAVSLLNRYGTLPEIRAEENGDIIEIKPGYRFPPAEEEFFKLYSWPLRYDFPAASPQVFVRQMAKQVYPVFRHELESAGYHFVEE